MPQLDKASWFSQIFWLLFFFFILYYFFFKYLLPTIGSTLKLRSKLLQKLAPHLERDVSLFKEIETTYKKILNFFTIPKTKLLFVCRRRFHMYAELYSSYLWRSAFLRPLSVKFVRGYMAFGYIFDTVEKRKYKGAKKIANYFS